MKILLMTCAVVAVASAASAQNRIDVRQIGIGNMQATIQSGRNAATITQFGSGNEVQLEQNGDANVAGIAQIGEGLTRSVVQDGDRLGYGSIQATSPLTGSFSRTGGNSFTSTTGQLDVE